MRSWAHIQFDNSSSVDETGTNTTIWISLNLNNEDTKLLRYVYNTSD